MKDLGNDNPRCDETGTLIIGIFENTVESGLAVCIRPLEMGDLLSNKSTSINSSKVAVLSTGINFCMKILSLNIYVILKMEVILSAQI